MNLTSIFIFIVAVILNFNFTRGFFASKLKKVKEKAKNYYQKNFRKDKSWHFLDHDPALFPGTDKEYRKENQKKWDTYYDCLREQESALGLHGTPVPEAIQSFEGGMVKFQCKICLSPKEQDKLESISWYYGKSHKKFLEIILYNDHIMLAPEDKSLLIYNLNKNHVGQYVCILGDSVTVPYYLNVENGTFGLNQVHSESSSIGPYPKAPQVLPESNLILETEWGHWSPCSKCKQVGKRHKLGYCTVKYLNNAKKARSDLKTKNSFLENLKQAFFNESFKLNFKKTKPEDKENKVIHINETQVELIQVFQLGIPCRSEILPKSIKNNVEVKNRSDEVIIGFCKVKCPTEEIFEVRDKHGKVLERANNSAGEYSMVQGLPPVAPPVQRLLQYAKMGDSVIIMCPGNLNSEDPLHWQINSKIVIPDVIVKESKGRVIITLLDRIQISKAKVSDSNLYSCWQHNELAGTVRLVVEKRVQLSFNHHLMLIGMIFILGTFIYVFMRALVGRKYATIGQK